MCIIIIIIIARVNFHGRAAAERGRFSQVSALCVTTGELLVLFILLSTESSCAVLFYRGDVAVLLFVLAI